MDKIKSYIWYHIIPLRFLIWFRDKTFNKPNGIHKIIRKIVLSKSCQFGHDLFDFPMTEELAKFIRDLRFKEPNGYTWRAISREVYDKFPRLRQSSKYSGGVIRGDQMDGKWLCEYAMRYYNEDWY